jgi:hypothetical protein
VLSSCRHQGRAGVFVVVAIAVIIVTADADVVIAAVAVVVVAAIPPLRGCRPCIAFLDCRRCRGRRCCAAVVVSSLSLLLSLLLPRRRRWRHAVVAQLYVFTSPLGSSLSPRCVAVVFVFIVAAIPWLLWSSSLVPPPHHYAAVVVSFSSSVSHGCPLQSM